MVKFILADSCDERLIQENIFDELEQSCYPVEPEPESETSPEEPVDPQNPQDPEDPQEPEGPSEDEILDAQEKAEFTPRWIRLLTD